MTENLLEILSLDIPKAENRQEGFLEISGTAHLENVNSRVYAYFLDRVNTKTANLFLYALTQIITEKSGKEIDLIYYETILELPTNAGNRIDITLKDIDNQSAIIIENKIYHHLHNDLKDYWNHFDYPEKNKIGILLTLHPQQLEDDVKDFFINITHIEWIEAVKQIGLPFDLPTNLYIYLNDFIRTIENLSKNYTMNSQAEFFFQHTAQILKAQEVLEQGQQFVQDQMLLLSHKLELDIYPKSNKGNFRNFWNEKVHTKTYYTVTLDKLLNGDRYIYVIIELQGEDMLKAETLDEMLKDDIHVNRLNKKTLTTKWNQHYLSQKYDLNISQIETLAETIHSIIKKDFEPVMEKIMAFIYPQLKSLE